MHARLLGQLLLPLLAATVAAIWLHTCWPADGFFLNLAAGFIGSLVTVFYVDLILKRHEQDAWREADVRIADRLLGLAASTITDVRVSFGVGTDVFEPKIFGSADPHSMHTELRRIASNVLSPAADTKVAALTQAGWKRFVPKLQANAAECGVLLDRFGYRLRPGTVAILMDLQKALESAQQFWHVFPDLAGVPKHELPDTRTPTEILQRNYCELTARYVRTTLELAVRLSTQASDASQVNTFK